MSPALIAAIAALVAGGSGPAEDVLVAYLPQAARQELNALVLQALPPPPAVVVRTTKRYGEVRIDHAKHLALRAPCRDCHETMPVTKIAFTPPVAHRACIGCHKERSSGPTQCAGCHERTLPQPEIRTAEAEKPTKPTPGIRVSPSGELRAVEPVAERHADGVREPAEPAARHLDASEEPELRTASGDSPPPADSPPRVASRRSDTSPASEPALPGHASRHIIDIGWVAGPGFGPSLRVSSRRDRLVTMYSFERVARRGDARLLGMLGAGISHRLHDRWEVVALAVGGFDAIEAPAVTVAPAIGARAGVEWLPRRWRLETIHVGVTGVVDLARGRAFGRDVPGSAVYATVATGLSARR